LADNLVRLRNLQRTVNLCIGGVFFAPLHVFADGTAKQNRLLRHDSDFAAQLPKRVAAHVNAVKQNPSRADIVKPRQKMNQRGFSGAGAADNTDGLAGTDGKVNAGQGVLLCLSVGKADVFKLYLRRARNRRLLLIFTVVHGRLNRKYLTNPHGRGGGTGQGDDQLRQYNQRKKNLRHIVHQRDDLALGQVADVGHFCALLQNQYNTNIYQNIG